MSSTPLVPCTAPPMEGKKFIPVVRCNSKVNFQVRCVVVSETWFGSNTHYAGRTIPCLAPGRPCKWCDKKRAKNWLGYLHGTDPVHRLKRFLVEFTPGTVGEFQRYLDQFGTLRGCYLQMTRSTPHPNAKLVVNLQPFQGCTPGELPPAGNLEDDLWFMWSSSLGLEPAADDH